MCLLEQLQLPKYAGEHKLNDLGVLSLGSFLHAFLYCPQEQLLLMVTQCRRVELFYVLESSVEHLEGLQLT